MKKLNYPPDKIEVIVVDNGSNDNSTEFLSLNFPEVKVIKNNQNCGFAVANNQGAREASGEYIAFLNNDTKVDEDWLIELLKQVYGDKEAVCAGSKVFSIDGKTLDFVGGMINFEGKGFQTDYGLESEKDIYNLPVYLPFVNGGAMLVSKSVFLGCGGFDEDFFAYYEDVDFGWRLWVLGYRVVFAPKSIVYHVHHGTSKLFDEDKLRFLKERNALYSVFKNYDDENLAKVFSGTLASIYSRIFTDFKFDYRKYYDYTLKNINKEPIASDISDKITIEKEPLSSLMAVKNFLDELPKLMGKRAKIQSARKRDDKAIFTYFGGQFIAISPDLEYQKTQIKILKSLGIYDIFQREIQRTLLIISDEVVSKEMAGPAIRAWNFAKILSEKINVILAVPNQTDLPQQSFKVVQFKDDSKLNEFIDMSDIILCGGMTFAKYKCIRNSDKYIIMDIYDPYNIATLAEYANETIGKQFEVYKSVHPIVNEMMYYGDFYICASERQRDFWLGMLSALNRVNPYSYNLDPQLKKLIDVVPFGLPGNKPLHTKQVLKGKIDGIKEADFVIIWGGGIYNWFDPLTLIKAMALVGKEREDIKLFFMGVRHPNPRVKETQLADAAVSLAKKLNLFDRNVFFNFGWIEYDERQNYLLESDAGIITHPGHIETRFAFRTRILDYLWAGLPIISTKGDSLSEIVEQEKLGITVSEGDVSELAKAIIEIYHNRKFYSQCKTNISAVAQNYTWEKVCEPIIKFCREPVPNAVRKKLRPEQINENIDFFGNSGNGGRIEKEEKRGKSYLIKRFFYHLFKSGAKKTFEYSSHYLKK
ncbi:MAG: glycosyltransferase [Actinobacteria bacterium]|nr:glycosyltransferase [Actinomycetota bacterium]